MFFIQQIQSTQSEGWGWMTGFVILLIVFSIVTLVLWCVICNKDREIENLKSSLDALQNFIKGKAALRLQKIEKILKEEVLRLQKSEKILKEEVLRLQNEKIRKTQTEKTRRRKIK